MSVAPQGRSVQAMYRDYREGRLLVNRRYQRKLVWTTDEKRHLIDSVLKGYPIPLILLAERREANGDVRFEIIDGIQRFNAVFSFLENEFDYDGRFFDVDQFATARNLADGGAFTPSSSGPFLDAAACAKILDYQLAITVYPSQDETEITTVFGRINARGRQLSPQERRQAGVTSGFADLVRSLSAELRGDVSRDILPLSQMPEISVESTRQPLGYGISAEETIWCKQGILSVPQLKDSEDEQQVADLAASVLLETPLPMSRELMDTYYTPDTDESNELERRLTAYDGRRLVLEIKSTFSILKNLIEDVSDEAHFLRNVVRAGSTYPIKAPFYAIFMALFDLVVRRELTPTDPESIFSALEGLDSKLKKGAHYETTENRIHNINLTKGLIQDHFVDAVPPAFGHGPSLLFDFENALRRSRVETSRFEFKQGVLRLDSNRELDNDLLDRLVKTSCGIGNLGPDSDGHIFIGVADSKQDALRIEQIDGIRRTEIAGRYVVGVDREATALGVSLDDYMQTVIRKFQQSELTEPIKRQILSKFDCIDVRGQTVIHIYIPPQSEISFVGQRTYSREGSSTVEVTGQDIVSVSNLFRD